MQKLFLYSESSDLSTLPSPWTTKPNYLTPAAHAHTGNEAKLGKWEGGIPAPCGGVGLLCGGEIQCTERLTLI